MNPSWRSNNLRYKSFFLNVLNQYREKGEIRYYLEILLSLATVSIFSVFALRPTILTIAELVRQIDTREETLTKMNSKIAQINAAQILYDTQRENIEILNSAVPKSPEPAVFARQIEGLSVKHEIAITDLTINKATLIGGVNEEANNEETSLERLTSDANELKFTLRGETPSDSYLSLISFVKDIESLRQPVKIDSILIESAEDEEEEKNIILTIIGRVPYKV